MSTLPISPGNSPADPSTPAGGPSDNTGRMMTKRVRARDRSTVILSFKTEDANAMRAFVNSIRIHGDKAPSQSTVARRALQVYLRRLEVFRREAPSAYAEEVAALEAMVTPVPQPAREDQRKKPK